MQTSNKQIATEAVFVGGLAAGVTVLLSPSAPWMASVALHPTWIGVLALSAFYGLRGLMIAAPIGWAWTALVAVVVGAGPGALAERVGGGADALALLICAAVAAAAMVHRNRHRELAERLAAAEKTSKSAATRAADLNALALSLQARQDRIDCSIAYWRSLATSLEGDSAEAAAQAALELCMARTGARAGLVRRIAGGRLHNLAWRGRWTNATPVPRDIFRDRTIDCAVAAGAIRTADETPGADVDDSDVAVPVYDTMTGELVAVVALRGIEFTRLGAGEIADLATVAGWVSPAIAREQKLHGQAVNDEQAVKGPSAKQVLLQVAKVANGADLVGADLQGDLTDDAAVGAGAAVAPLAAPASNAVATKQDSSASHHRSRAAVKVRRSASPASSDTTYHYVARKRK